MDEEWKAQDELKIYLDRVLSLRPAKNMSALSFFIFKLGKEILNAIGEDAGFIEDRKRYLQYFYSLKLHQLPAEEAKVLDVILEGLEWIKHDSTLWEWELEGHKGGIPTGLHGDEVFYAFDFAMMTDKEIEEHADPDPLSRLKSIGVEVSGEIEDLKLCVPTKKDLERMKETHNVISPEFDVWQGLERQAKEAGSDFFDYVSDETLNVISDCVDLLDEVFEEYLGEEMRLKGQVQAICPDTFIEKWKIFLKVVVQAIYQSNVLSVHVDEIPKLLPFISDMRFLWDTLEVKVGVFDPKLIYLFGNLGADQYGEEEGWFTAWWD